MNGKRREQYEVRASSGRCLYVLEHALIDSVRRIWRALTTLLAKKKNATECLWGRAMVFLF
jgi:hypothetical protein